MKRFLVSAIAAGVIAVPAFAAIEQGAKAPDFKTQASLAGKEFSYSLKDALKKGPVVVYFYPAAFTGGCNLQAHTFAENIDKFSAAGASVIGVSLDKISTPPGTGTIRPPESAANVLKKAGSFSARDARLRVPTPMPSAPQAFPCAISGRSKLEPSSALRAMVQPRASNTATVRGTSLCDRA